MFLIVDSDTDAALVLTAALEATRLSCSTAVSGHEALAQVCASAPQAIFVDLSLPDMSGLDLLGLLKRDPQLRHIPVHATSNGPPSRLALLRGAAGCLEKPISPHQLAKAIKTCERYASARKRRVLVIGGNDSRRASVEQILGGQNAELVGADTAQQGLHALLSTQTFDCVTLDPSLPDFDGFSLLAKLYKSGKQMPAVVVYSGAILSDEEFVRIEAYADRLTVKCANTAAALREEVSLFLHTPSPQLEQPLPRVG